MQSVLRRTLSFMLAIIMILTLIPVSFAEGLEESINEETPSTEVVEVPEADPSGTPETQETEEEQVDTTLPAETQDVNINVETPVLEEETTDKAEAESQQELAVEEPAKEPAAGLTEAPVEEEPTEVPVEVEPTEDPVEVEPTEDPVEVEPTEAPADVETVVEPSDAEQGVHVVYWTLSPNVAIHSEWRMPGDVIEEMAIPDAVKVNDVLAIKGFENYFAVGGWFYYVDEVETPFVAPFTVEGEGTLNVFIRIAEKADDVIAVDAGAENLDPAVEGEDKNEQPSEGTIPPVQDIVIDENPVDDQESILDEKTDGEDVILEEDGEEKDENPVEDEEESSLVKVTFVSEGEEVAVFALEPGTALENLPEDPVSAKAGYIFGGWFFKDAEFEWWNPVEEDITVEAQYRYMPAQTLTQSSSSVTVTASWEAGTFPDGTQLSVSDVKPDDALEMAKAFYPEMNIVDAIAFDISFYANDSKVQPEKGVNISVQLNDGITVEGSSFHLIHQGGGFRKLLRATGPAFETKSVSASGAEFIGNSFSIYAIVGEGEVHEDARLTVKFVKADGSEQEEIINARQLPSIEKYIYDPGIGTQPDDTLFKGWTNVQNYTATTPAKTIKDIRTEVKSLLESGEVAEGDIITYYAMIFDPYNVKYLDERSNAISVDQVLYRHNDMFCPKASD